MQDAGYFVKGKLVNFGEYGVPQKRTRFILIGIRNDVPNASKERAEEFFSLLEQNKYSFLKDKNLNVGTTLKEAISDLLKSNGVVQSPDTASYKAGIYSDPQSSYQQLMRGGIDANVPDSHRFPKHRDDITEKFGFIWKRAKIKI